MQNPSLKRYKKEKMKRKKRKRMDGWDYLE
jgi:hypothetical protein